MDGNHSETKPPENRMINAKSLVTNLSEPFDIFSGKDETVSPGWCKSK